MDQKASGAALRLALLALAALAIWLAGATFTGLPAPKGFDAPPTEYSAARADATLARLLGPEVPHPISSPANHAVRDRIRAEFAALRIKTTLYRATGCNARPRYGFFACGTVEDVIADVLPGEGKAIVLLAHYDSVPAGPGAADDQSGVATVIETVRALKARGLKSEHPIIALLTDGEEAGLLGASAFVDDPALRARVGVAVNAEARGNRGPSLLFQTSPGDARLIDLYAGAVPEYATSSLFAVIYKLLPNDTDLTMFLNKGLTGYNFAFSENIAHYHTALDRRANISPQTLQNHGDNVLGIATALMRTDFAALKGGDAIYLTVFGHLLPRLPAGWALPLAILALVLLFVTAWMSRGEVLGIGRRLVALSVPLAALAGAVAVGWLLHTIASLIAGQPNPSYAHPIWLRIALGFGVATIIIAVSRMTSARMVALSVWFWMAALALVTAALLPGFSPYFLFPALVAAILLPPQAVRRDAWIGPLPSVALFLAALPALVVWFALSAASETIQGLSLHFLFTISLTFGAIALLPLLAARPLTRESWRLTLLGSSAAAILFAVTAGLQPTYSPAAPQRLNVDFVDDHVAHKGVWAIETGAPLPGAFRAVMPFSADSVALTPFVPLKDYVGPPGALRFAAPVGVAASKPNGAGRVVTLTLPSAPRANRLIVVVPKDAALMRLAFDGKNFTPVADNLNPAGTIFACVTDDCAGKPVTLVFANRRPLTVTLGAQIYGIPADGQRLEAIRPANTVAAQNGDATIIFARQVL
ncbi:MAG TPA: M20/M25/M40 family metallo-hydrolase [Rhizomicrobium sp.]|nr:M20/M25/M40 family metallo-hydrolase [Rhizomicrobium sp.]